MDDELTPTTTEVVEDFRKTMLCPQGDGNRFYRVDSIIQETLLAASQAEIALKWLRFNPVNYDVFQLSTEDLQTIEKAVAKVEVLAIRICRPVEKEEKRARRDLASFHTTLDKRYLVHFLEKASKLRHLSITQSNNTDPFNIDHDTLTPTRYIVGSAFWLHLAVVEFTWFACSEADLLAFLLRHKTSLTSFAMSEGYMSRGPWVSFFARLAGTLPLLNFVWLASRFVSDCKGVEYQFGYENPSALQDSSTFMRKMQSFLINGGELPEPPSEHLSDPSYIGPIVGF